MGNTKGKKQQKQTRKQQGNHRERTHRCPRAAGGDPGGNRPKKIMKKIEADEARKQRRKKRKRNDSEQQPPPEGGGKGRGRGPQGNKCSRLMAAAEDEWTECTVRIPDMCPPLNNQAGAEWKGGDSRGGRQAKSGEG